MITAILSKIASIFVLIVIGYAAMMTGLMKQEYIPGLNRLLFSVITPIMLIYSMSSRTYDPSAAADTLWCVVAYILLSYIILFVMKLFAGFLKLDDYDRSIAAGAMAFTNIGYIGIPLAALLFGSEVEMNVIIMNIGYNLAFFTGGVAIIFREKGQPVFSAAMLKKIFNLPLIGALIGLVLYLANIDLPDVIASGFSSITSMMTPLSMIIVGMQMAQSNIIKLINPTSIAICIMKLFIAPAVALAAVMLLPLSPMVALTLVFVFSLPTASLIMITAQEYGRDTRFSSECIVLTTFFCMVSLPVWTVILTYIYGL